MVSYSFREMKLQRNEKDFIFGEKEKKKELLKGKERRRNV